MKHTLKRVLSLVLSLAFVLSMFPVQFAAAEGKPTIQIGTATADFENLGAEDTVTVTVPVMLQNNPGFAGMDLIFDVPDGWTITYIDYDYIGEDGEDIENCTVLCNLTYMSFQGLQIPQATPFTTPTINTATGAFIVAFNGQGGPAETADGLIHANGPLCWLVMEVPAMLLDGDYPITVTANWINNTDTETDMSSQFDLGAGSVTVVNSVSEADVTPVAAAPAGGASVTYETGVELTASAEVTTAGEDDIVYQWYVSDSETGLGTMITDAADATLALDVDDFDGYGTSRWFYYTATNTYQGKTFTATSARKQVSCDWTVISDVDDITFTPVNKGNEALSEEAAVVTGTHGNYTVSTVWYDENGEVATESEASTDGDVTYTAELTIAPTTEKGIAFDAATTVAVNATAYNATLVDSNLVVEIPCTISSKTLTGIAVATNPTKTSGYYSGDKLDTTGLTLTASYDDGSTATITEGFTADEELRADQSVVAVNYGTQTCSVTIDPVTQLAITSIEVTKTPTTTTYKIGDELDTAGLEVTAVYNKPGKTEVLSAEAYTLSGFDSGKYAAEQMITVTYNENDALTDTFTVTINRLDLTAEDFALSSNTVDYTGTAAEATVTANAAYAVGEITILYDGGETVPTEVDVYTVSIKVEQNDYYNEITTPLELGTYTINAAEITASAKKTLELVNNGRDTTLVDDELLTINTVNDQTPSVSYAVKSGSESYIAVSDQAVTPRALTGETTAYIVATITAPNHNETTVDIPVEVLDKTPISDKLAGLTAVSGAPDEYEELDYQGETLDAFVSGLDTSAITEDGTPSVLYTLQKQNGTAWEVWGMNASLSELTIATVGTYRVVAEYEDLTQKGTLTSEPFTIAKTQVAEPSAVTNLVYDSTERTGVIIPADVNYLLTSGTTKATDAGDYTATFTLLDPDNYEWADGADGVVAWSIARMKIAVPEAKTGLIYNGDPQTGVPAATDGSYTITGNEGTDADDYTAQVTPSPNHQWEDGTTGTKTVSWSIAQQEINVDAEWNYTAPFTYNGEAKTVAVTGVDTDAVEITYGGVYTATNAGSYNASATFAAKDDNYVVSGTIADLEWEILKATVTVPTAVTGLEYNGETQTGVVLPENAVYTLTGNTGVNAADTYSATATLRDPANYKWNDGGEETATRSIGWSIAKADAVALTSGKGLRFDNTSAQTVTADDILALLNDDNEATTVTIVSVDTGTNSILAADASVVEGAVSYALTSGLSEENDGDTAVLTITFSSNNYEDSTVAFTVSVMEKVNVDYKIDFANGSAVYTGAAQQYKTATMTDSALTGTITYEAPEMKDVDTYTVKAIYEDADNYGEKEVYFTITAAELTITDATVAPKTYDGNTTADVTEVSFDGLLGEDVMSDAGYTVTAANFNDADVKDANAVTFTVELDSSDAVARNYKLKSATATVNATITPATITPTVEVIADQSFTGSALTPAVTVLNGSAVMDEADYSVSYDQTTNINVGTSTVTVSDVAGSNYTFSDVTADFDIIPAAAPETISGVSAGYRYSLAGQKSVKITGIPANAGTVTAAIGTVENSDGVLTGTPTASFDGTDVVVSFVLTGFDAYTENLSATIPVTVSMTNYESKTVDVMITITDKEPVVLAANNITRDYTGKALSASAITGTATCEGATVAGTWSFVDYDATTMVNAGSHTVKVKFTPNDPETYDEAEITITITIKKIAPTGEPSVTPIRRENMTLADAELNVGTLNPAEGSLFWYDDEDTIVMENKAYRWGFIPDNENYTPLNGEIIPYVVQYIEPGEGGGDRPGAGSSTTEDDKTGAVTETIVTDDGVVGTTVTERDGTVSSIEVEIPEAAADKAAERGEAIVLPIEVTSTSNEKSAQEIEITAPYGETKIEIPVTNASNSTVAVIVGMYGREDVVAAAAVRKDGIVLTIHGNVTLKIVDRKMMFNDVHYVAHWSEAAVDFVTARGIMNGMTETEFAPDLQLTRGMLWTILARLDGVDTAGGAEWYSKGMDWARNNGISDGLYPNNNITREEAITMLWRYAKQPTMSRDYLAGYADGSLTSDWAEDAMNWAISVGLIKGDENGLLNPNGTATRAEITTMLMRFIQNIL